MDDFVLKEGVCRGDKLVFDYIFNYYYSSLCSFSMRYLKDRNAAEDLVQDFFVTFWIDAQHLKISTSLRSYLFTGIRNRCLDFNKHQKVADKYKSFVVFMAENEDNSFEHYFAESELRQTIEKCLSKLSPRCQEIFRMNRFEGLTNQEISERLGISKRTVELQISNSLKVLRKELVDYIPLFLISWIIA